MRGSLIVWVKTSLTRCNVLNFTLYNNVRSLKPGVGSVIIGDHVGQISLFDHLKLLERAGFVDVECSWRNRDFFVCGARVPRS